MTILYLHGFGATLNGRKASCLRAHFGQRAVVEPPDPGFPYGRALAHPMLQRLGQKLRNEPKAFLGLLGPNRLGELARLSPELVDLFPRSVAIAQALYDTVHPDLIVGTSLGGSVAMAMNARDTPMVLIDPVWNRDIKTGVSADLMPAGGPMGRAFIAAAIAAMRNPVARLARFDVPQSVKPKTIILHSAHDHVFRLANSRRLLRNSAIAAGDPHRRDMDRVIDGLAAAGYANRKSTSQARFNDGRLIVIGKDHHNNEPDPHDRHNKDPHPHRALIAAVRSLLAAFAPRLIPPRATATAVARS